MPDLVTAFVLVAVAEVGDKSQLLALSFATRYPWWKVVLGVAVAALTLLGLAAVLGAALGDVLPIRVTSAVGGVLFLGFAVWTWRARDADDLDVPADRAGGRGAVVRVVAAFLVAELGDKTMMSTAALASTGHPIAVWVGASAGMIAASTAAIVVGVLLQRRMPASRLRQVAAVGFAVVGTVLLVAAASG